MGPRSFNRGNQERSPGLGVDHFASMGPRSFNRGNVNWFTDVWKGAQTLQWGRGLSTAETPLLTTAAPSCVLASMGPRSFNRGNFLEIQTVTRPLNSFNGAAVFHPGKLRYSCAPQ